MQDPAKIIALEIHIAAIDASIEKILDTRAKRAAEQVFFKGMKFRFSLSASTGRPAWRKLLKSKHKLEVDLGDCAAEVPAELHESRCVSGRWGDRTDDA